MEKDAIWEDIITSGKLGSLPATLLSETTSTNEIALQAALQGAVTNSLYIAETQSMGRGRLGKTWLSPPGCGLYFSMILRPALAPEDLPKITLAAGLATCKAVHANTGLNPMIKWPNDLLLNNKKFAGILAETESIGNGNFPIVVLGIGINVNTSESQFPAELREKATSIKRLRGEDITRGPLLKNITDEIIRTLSHLEKEGFSEILSEWKKYDATFDRELQWVTQKGEIIKGVSLGPDNEGLLKVMDKEGTIHEVLSGDINLASLITKNG